MLSCPQEADPRLVACASAPLCPLGCDEQARMSIMDVLLADDQAKVRSALRLVLEHQPDIDVLGEAVNATGLLDWVKAASPDVVLLDWELPGLSRGVLGKLRALCPTLDIIALSGQPEARQAALAAGVDGFVSKGDPPEKLLTAIAAR
mgnify:FL=1